MMPHRQNVLLLMRYTGPAWRGLQIFILALIVSGCASKPPRNLMGAYQFNDGRLISIRASQDNTLRYRELQNGESRRLYRHRRLRYVAGHDFTARTPVELVVDFKMGKDGRATGLSWKLEGEAPRSAEKIGIEEWMTFASGDINLFGRLDLPTGPGPHPAIVLVHGSGKSAATDFLFTCDFFAATGIATLTFDKRGTGRSEGTYNFDFDELAGDVVAAVEYLKSRPDIDLHRIGLSGYSQGGWVAPLAASMTDDVSYVIVNFGMIESPAEEARIETRNSARRLGVDEESLKEIDELTLAGVKVIASGFKDWEEFDEIKKKYKDAKWRKQLKGTTVDDLLKYPHFIVKLFGPMKAPKGLDWYYDSTEVLQGLDIPMVWLLGGKDESAPNELTIPKLREMISDGWPYELVVFPEADHSMLLFREEDGGRVYTGYARDYFSTQVDWAGRLSNMVQRRD